MYVLTSLWCTVASSGSRAKETAGEEDSNGAGPAGEAGGQARLSAAEQGGTGRHDERPLLQRLHPSLSRRQARDQSCLHLRAGQLAAAVQASGGWGLGGAGARNMSCLHLRAGQLAAAVQASGGWGLGGAGARNMSCLHSRAWLLGGDWGEGYARNKSCLYLELGNWLLQYRQRVGRVE